jgi:hypothetical protein
MALNDFINDYPGWQNAAKANAQATRELAAAQREADSTPTTNKAAFNDAITKLNAAKQKRDTTKAKVDGIVSTATREFNAQSDKSELAKTQKQFDIFDNEIKRLEALGRTPSELLEKQRTDAQNKLMAMPGYTTTSGQPSGEPAKTPKQTKQKLPPDINISTSGTGGNVPGPSTGTSQRTVEEELAIMRNNVNKQGSFEQVGSATAELGVDNFSQNSTVKAQIESWAKPGTSKVGNRSRLEDIQILLRESKLSKGDTPLGIFDKKDIAGLMSAVQTAKFNGQTTEFFLDRIYTDKLIKGNTASSGGGLAKTISSGLKLLDVGDASDKLSKAYYKAYGRYPTQKQIISFKDQWNQEAKTQLAETASYRSKGFNKDITVGEGFTESEQSAFLNRYLIKNLKVDAANLGGDTKKIYDDIRSIYRDNFLPEPEFAQVAGVVKDLIGTADANVYNTKIAQVKQTVGKQAAAFYPSISEALLNGENVETYASVYRNSLAKKWGVTAESLKYDNEAQDLVKSAVNFKTADNKSRLMDNNEFNSLVQSTKRWKASEEAFTSYSNIGDKLINAFNLQGGVR